MDVDAGPVPPPETLWTETAIRAVVCVGLGSLRNTFTVTGEGVGLRDHYRDIWWELSWVEGGDRAVFYGNVPSAWLAGAVASADPLAGGPGWLPWERLTALQRDLGLSFVYWWDGSRWGHAPYPDRPETTTAHGGGAHALDRCDGLPPARVDLDTGDARAAYDALREAAHRRQVTESLLEAVLPRLSLDPRNGEPVPRAALQVAAWTGLAPGSGRPRLPAGAGEPAGRRPPIAAPERVSRAIVMASRSAPELTRPEHPEPDTVVRWMVGRGSIGLVTGFGGDGLMFSLHGRWESMRPSTPEAEIIDAWREAEGDPRTGRWLHALIAFERSPDPDVLRAYDTVPVWWTGPSPGERALRAIQEEFMGRDPAWRPEWTPLLGEVLDAGLL